MLDEPLGALDRALRERLLDDLHGILRRLKQTAIYVTHDQEEAFALADRVVILRQGRVMQQGTPAEVYARPASRFVAEFLGQRNILPAQIERQDGRVVAVTPAGILTLPDGAEPPGAAPAWVLVRAEGVQAAPQGLYHLAGQVREASFRGSRSVVEVEANGQALTVEFPPGQPVPAVGETLRLRVDPAAVYLLPPEPAAPEKPA
jgi:thiamine transport system ATP-binding protein